MIDKLLVQLVPMAASLRERRFAPWLKYPEDTPGSDLARERWALWVNQAAIEDESEFTSLLKERAIDPDSALSSLGAVELDDEVQLPEWAVVLRQLLGSASVPPVNEDAMLARSLTADGKLAVGDGATLPIRVGFAGTALAGFVPWARAAMRQASAARTTIGEASVEHAASGKASAQPPAGLSGLEDSLVAGFLHQVLHMSFDCLRGTNDSDFESGIGAMPGWVKILQTSPALGRVLGIIALNWSSYATELVERITSDLAELEVAFSGADSRAEFLPIGCGLAAGDKHDQGRSVVGVDFNRGSRIYYKPKDLRIGDALTDLIERLDAGLELPRRLSKDGYHWEEEIEATKPPCTEDWANVAYQLGMWVRLFDVLGSNDMMEANVLIAGHKVIPIDTETIVPFLFVPSETQLWLPAGARTALLTAPVLTRSDAGFPNCGILASKENAPLLEHLDSLRRGFDHMHERLVTRREKVMQALDQWADLPVRAVIRNTWIYFRILMDSLRREALADGVQREMVIERLWRAQLKFGLPPEVVEAEASALLDLDVPLFRFMPGYRYILCPGGTTASDALHEPPIEAIRARLAALDHDPDHADLDGLDSQAFCASPVYRSDQASYRSPGFEPVGSNGVAITIEIDWREESRKAADELLGFLRQGGPAGRRLDAGLSYVAHNSLFMLAAHRGADLLSGSAGIAVVLAELASKLDEPELRAEARVQCSDAASCMNEMLDVLHAWYRKGTDPPLFGLHWGLTGALSAISAIPRDVAGSAFDSALMTARELLERFDPDAAFDTPDLVQPASLLLTLHSLDRPDGPLAAPLQDALSSMLADRMGARIPDPRISPLLAPMIPSGLGTAALALSRHADANGTSTPEVVSSWRDSNCITREGDRLVLAALGMPQPRDIEPETSLEMTVRIEDLLVEFRHCRSGELLDEARRYGAAIIARRQKYGRWFPESLAADRYRLSAMWGLAGIAYWLAALVDPGSVTSLRLLEFPDRRTQSTASPDPKEVGCN